MTNQRNLSSDGLRTYRERGSQVYDSLTEGGGECGIDNFRTLCIPCHKKGELYT
jgi:hypothetical protein